MLHYLNGLQETNLLVNTAFIPDDEIFLKIGRYHGGGSFKTSFQVANVEHPNKPENTVFSVTEAKDNKSNLMLCLERFKTHIAMFEKVKWSDGVFKVLLFGDYQVQVENIHVYGVTLQKIIFAFLNVKELACFHHVLWIRLRIISIISFINTHQSWPRLSLQIM